MHRAPIERVAANLKDAATAIRISCRVRNAEAASSILAPSTNFPRKICQLRTAAARLNSSMPERLRST
jgi:hypothetical protein